MALSDETEEFLRRHSAGEHEHPARYSEPAAQSPVAETEAATDPRSLKTWADRIEETILLAACLMLVVAITNVFRMILGGPAVDAAELSWVDVVMDFFSAGMVFAMLKGNSVLTMNRRHNNT